jgi:prepilin-type N-terminal cleavage/methylation domain-containing protein
MQLTLTKSRRARHRLPWRADRGVTLIELLVAIAILGIISVPLGNALITFFQHTDETTNRLSESHDAQIAAAYFTQDVGSIGRRDWTAAPFPLAQSVEVNVPATGGLYPCGTDGTPDAAARLLWDDPSAAQTPSVIRVAYVVETVSGASELHRIKCVGASTTPVSDLVLIHNLSSVDPVQCSTACTGTSGQPVPQTVTLVVHIQVPSSGDPILTVTLTGQRRQT